MTARALAERSPVDMRSTSTCPARDLHPARRNGHGDGGSSPGPRCEARRYADLGAQPSGVGGDGLQCLSRDPHQQCIHDRLVLESDLGDCRRQGEDHVEVRDRQQIRDTRRDPLLARRPLALRTVAIAAGIMGDACQATVVARIDVTAEPRGQASTAPMTRRSPRPR